MSPERIRPGSARARGAAPGPAGAAPGAGTPGRGAGEAADEPRRDGTEEVAFPLDEVPAAGDEEGAGEVPIALPLAGKDELDSSISRGDPVRIVGPQQGDRPLRPEEFVDLAAAEEVLGHERVDAYRRGADAAAGSIDELDEALVEGDLAAASAGAGARHERAFLRLYHGRTRFDFVRRKRIWFAISLTVIVAGLISLGFRGLNLGIDFAGGTSWQVGTSTASVGGTQLIDNTRTALSPYGLGGSTITILGSNKSTQTIQVEAKLGKGGASSQTLGEIAQVSAALAKVVHAPSAKSVSVDQVGPSWGSSVTDKAILALVVFFILISLYISIFFEWRMALAAVAAVAHDVLVVVGIYSLSGLQVTPDTVVAILTILGYSLYDTIVVFDRVRDNIKSPVIGGSNRISITDIINLSMNQTLARSINTSLVAILPIFAVLVLGADVLGATTLQYFGWALLIGLLSGAYSSIFIASPLVGVMKEREQHYRFVREKLAQRGVGTLLLSPEAVAAGVFGAGGELAQTRRQRRAGASGGARSSGAPGRPGGPRGSSGGRSGGRVTPGAAGRAAPRAGGAVPSGGGLPSASGLASGGRQSGGGGADGGAAGDAAPGRAVPPARLGAGSGGASRVNGRAGAVPGAGTAGRPPARRSKKGRPR
ncbi:MAG TPA: protein translocase subunit SecF [Acidimicrobiales bacterium]|nr:protein translocase subunit SecF [Acidimicrobiales bacterium]